MRQRVSASTRPLGTDGSDFSYRMVVDSRYQKVAVGKSRLHVLILIQAVILLTGVVYLFVSLTKEAPDRLAISSAALGFTSLLIGELGRRRSRVNLLKLYLVASSGALLLHFASVAGNNYIFEDIKDLSSMYERKVELLEIFRFILGRSVDNLFTGVGYQTMVIIIATSLIRNMSPPRRSF